MIHWLKDNQKVKQPTLSKNLDMTPKYVLKRAVYLLINLILDFHIL